MTQAAHGPKTVFETKVTDYSDASTGTGANSNIGRIGDIEGIGTIRQEGDKWYRWVKNGDASTLVAGQPVCYKVASGESFHEIVDTPASADLNTFAGIAMAAAVTSGYLWIQIEGYNASCQMSIGTDSIAAGVNFRPANAASYLVGGAQQSVTVNSVSNQMVGRVQLAASIASSASTGGTSNAAGFIHCLTV